MSEPQNTRHRTREIATLCLLIAFYLLCSIRYFPNRPLNTLVETLIHILSVAPFFIGLTLILTSFLQKLAGERLPFDRYLRIFLTMGILFEIFYGLYHYLSLAQTPKI